MGNGQVMAGIAVIMPVIVALYIVSTALLPTLTESSSSYAIANETFSNGTSLMPYTYTLAQPKLKLNTLSAYCAIDSSTALTSGTNYTLDQGTGKITLTSLGLNNTRSGAYEFGDYKCRSGSVGLSYQYLKGAALPNTLASGELAVFRIGILIAGLFLFMLIAGTFL